MKFNEMFGNARWIKATENSSDVFFRGSFFAEKPENTKITICGLGFFRLYVNGKRVGNNEFTPVTSFYHDRKDLFCRDEFGEKIRSRIYVEKYDISDYLKDGENEIIVHVGMGWYYEFASSPVLCFRIYNPHLSFVSDEKIVCAPGPVKETAFHRFEHQSFVDSDYDIITMAPSSGYSPCIKADIPETEYYLSNCPNDTVIRRIIPYVLKKTDKYIVYDAGENITGTYVFSCKEPGKAVEVSCAESLDESGNLSEKYIHNQVSVFETDGTDREYRLLFTWAAFRYLKIDVSATLVGIDVIHTDVKCTSFFSSGNMVLDWLYEAFIRTQLCNMHAGIPSDCPHLERRGYTGDGQLVCETAMLTLGVKDFYIKWMEDISDCQDEISGHVQYTAPYHNCGGGPGGWGCAIAMVPYQFYKRYGDISPMKKYYKQALHYLDYLEEHSENNLVVSDQPGLWCLGDWCTPHEVHGMKPEIPEPFVNNYFYVKTIDVLIETAEITGNSEYIPVLAELRQKKTDALVENYYDPETGNFAANVNGSNSFAVDIGLGDERTFAEVVRHVREDVPDYGIFGIEITARVLCEKGYVADVINMFSRTEYPSFGYMMNSGSTTLWEEWKNPRSMSHPMFGAVVKLLFSYIVGIRQPNNYCGYRTVIISPFVNEITGDVKGCLKFENGEINVTTFRSEGIYTVDISDGFTAVCRDGNDTVTVHKKGRYTFRLSMKKE